MKELKNITEKELKAGDRVKAIRITGGGNQAIVGQEVTRHEWKTYCSISGDQVTPYQCNCEGFRFKNAGATR